MSSSRHLPRGTRLAKRGIVVARGGPGDWDAGMVESPMVWYDLARRQYGMSYTGYALANPGKRGYAAVALPRIGLAWSDDLLRWHKDPRNPVFGPDPHVAGYDREGTAGPFVWYEKERYYLYYFGTTEAGYERGTKTLNLATSPDLVTWERHSGNPIITPSGSGWRRDAIWHPHIVKSGMMYYLFFNASGVVGTMEEETIGYATSFDLESWTVDDDHAPVLRGSAVPGSWDATGRAGDPSLYRVGETWYMSYYSWDGVNSQDGIAWTSIDAFPLGWRPWSGNPVLRIGVPGSFDALHAGKPYIVDTPEGHFHFYTAVDDDESREIALAVEF